MTIVARLHREVMKPAPRLLDDPDVREERYEDWWSE